MNTAPQVTSGTAAIVAEGRTGIVYQATATDANGDTLTWTLSGADAALFTIDAATGAVAFKAAPDHEAPADADGDNVYAITVTASDGVESASRDVGITVTDRTEGKPANFALASSNPFAAIDVGDVSDPAFLDIDGDGDLDLVVGAYDGKVHAYENVGGSFQAFATNPFAGLDAGEFSQVAAGDLDGDGDLDLVVAGYLTDYGAEFYAYTNAGFTWTALSEAARKGIFEVVDDLTFTTGIAMADVDGDGDDELALGVGEDAIYVLENTPGGYVYSAASEAWSAFLGRDGAADPVFVDLDRDGDLDMVVGNYDGTLTALENTGAGWATFASNPFAGLDVGDVATPSVVDLDSDGDLDLVIGNHEGTLVVYENIPVVPNSVPVITSGAAAAFAELGTGIAYQASATDVDGDTLTWSLSGADAALFAINAATGVVTFKATPDYETPADADGDNVYAITIVASDGTATASQTVTITVTDIDEAPHVTSGTAAIVAEGRTGIVYQATATDANGDTLTWTLSGADAALFTIDAATGAVAFKAAPDHEAPADADGDNVYAITVTASDGVESASRDVGITVTDRTEGKPANFALASSNPFAAIDVGDVSDPAFLDIDGDGDLDLVVGAYDGKVHAYENVGGSFQAFATNPFAGLDAGEFSQVAAGDLDGDGDLDLVVAGYLTDYGAEFYAYTNAGFTWTALSEAARKGVFEVVDDLTFTTGIAMADVDGDGDDELALGVGEDVIYVLENTPGGYVYSAASEAWSAFLGRDGAADPVFVDLDRDGDLDMVVGNYDGTLTALENTGAGWATFASNPFAGLDVGDVATPSVVDLDSDGDLDLVIGNHEGTLVVYENTTPPPAAAPVITSGSAAKFAEWGVGVAYQATATDANGDTLIWTLAGADAALFAIDAATGAVTFKATPDYEAPADADGDNAYAVTVIASDGALTTERAVTITVTNRTEGTPATTFALSTDYNFGAVAVAGVAGGGIALADLDTDGDLDLVVGTILVYQPLAAYENVGGSWSNFAWDPFASIGAGLQFRPTAFDLDDDGDKDLVIGQANGTLFAVINEGGFWWVSGGNPFAAVLSDSIAVPAFGDLDGDGDADLVLGGSDGTLRAWRNDAGTWTAFEVNPFAGIDVGILSAPVLIDLDGDGDLDLVVGNYDGTLAAFENTGAGFAAFAVNPLPAIGVGRGATPTVADMDGDGDLDLVVSNFYGGIFVYENITAPNAAPVITSAAAAAFAEAATGIAYQATATDADADSLAWSLSGADAALFAIDAATGAVTFKAVPDYEAPADADGDNVYRIIVIASDGTDSVSQAVAISVTDGVDRTLGTSGQDSLGGTAGADRIIADAGDDAVAGDAGADTLLGGEGADTLLGADGGDSLSGGAGEDRVDGGEGNDTLLGGEGADTLLGGGGDDALSGATGRDSADGGAGADTLLGGQGADTLLGGDGADSLSGDVDADLLHGGEAADTLLGGQGADTLLGASGADSLSGEAGTDQVEGGEGADTLWGDAGDDILAGGDGGDSLLGGAGDDWLWGGLGADTMQGHAGADSFVYASAAEGGDEILRFSGGDDLIEVSAAGFGGGLVAGAAASFAVNTTGLATSAAGVGQFVWEKDARVLWWDADGAGGSDAVAIASFTGIVGGANGLSAADIVIF